jgi:RNA polymerase sigma factor (sigma-70 family)
MPTDQPSFLHQLRRTALLGDSWGMTDGQLLECFVARRDETAFAALVRRHGPMVLGVCRRVLGHMQDAEDAFQAAFLVLARKAGSVGQRELVGNWLYGVAYRTALDARAAVIRRRMHERQVSAMPEPETIDGVDISNDLRPLLDRELKRLPDKFRVPVVLCDLEGRPRKEVAQQLGIPEGTLSGRLTTARRMLARRLARHGLAPSGAALTAALTQGAASAHTSPAMVESTAKAAVAVAEGGAAAVSASVQTLVQGVVRAMYVTKLKTATILILVAGIAVGAGLLALPPMAAQQPGAKPTEKRPATPPGVPKDKDKADAQGGPKGDTLAELKKLRGFWQYVPGGLEHQDGEQVVRGPAAGGTSFFIHEQQLIWLDKDGQPTGEEETLTLETMAEPKRIRFTTKGPDGKERLLRDGIYKWESLPAAVDGEAAADVLTIHIALDGRPAPRRFLELNKPIQGVDGREWLVSKAELSIKEIMEKAHLKPQNRSTRNNLDSKVIDGKASAAEQQDLLLLYTALSTLKPPRGDLGEWKARTGEMVEAAKAVIRRDAKASDRLTRAQDCKSCHDKHRPESSPEEYGLTPGLKMPFHVADFLNDKGDHNCGCPSVMIANSGGRGLIIWTRGAAEPAFRLARALDAGAGDGDKIQRFLIAFDADEKLLREKVAGIGRVLVGKARDSGKEQLDGRGVDAKVVVLVFLLDKKEVKAAWSFTAGELSDDKVKELAGAAKKFASVDN